MQQVWIMDPCICHWSRHYISKRRDIIKEYPDIILPLEDQTRFSIKMVLLQEDGAGIISVAG